MQGKNNKGYTRTIVWGIISLVTIAIWFSVGVIISEL